MNIESLKITLSLGAVAVLMAGVFHAGGVYAKHAETVNQVAIIDKKIDRISVSMQSVCTILSEDRISKNKAPLPCSEFNLAVSSQQQ